MTEHTSALASTPVRQVHRLLFLHANGYPAAVYRRFLDCLACSIEVVTIAALETPGSTPPVDRWRRMRDQVIERLWQLEAGDTAVTGITGLVGHSMGGYLSLMAACHRLPALHPVVLIDSPIPAACRGALLTFAQRTGLAYRLGPAPIAARRRHLWPDRDEARVFFAGKTFVQRWAPGVLDDFMEHALKAEGGYDDAGGGGGDGSRDRYSDSGRSGENSSGEDHRRSVTLRIAREQERDIYAHLPHREATRALRLLQAAARPVAMVAGRHSPEVRMAGWRANRRLFAQRLVVLDTSHLVPLEAPQACAEAVLGLLGLGAKASNCSGASRRED